MRHFILPEVGNDKVQKWSICAALILAESVQDFCKEILPPVSICINLLQVFVVVAKTLVDGCLQLCY